MRGLFDDFEVLRACSPKSMPPPLQGRNPSLYDIAGRLVNSPEATERLRYGLATLDQRFNLSTHLEEVCTSSSWRPRVHAELILLDKFWKKQLYFVAGDRYIGCSKPACYSCHHYIIAHPGRFAVPACHNNNWLKWRPPDIMNPRDEKSIKEREDILNRMVVDIRRDILRQIEEQQGPRRRQPDSNTEISSTIWTRGLQIPTDVILADLRDADITGASFARSSQESLAVEDEDDIKTDGCELGSSREGGMDEESEEEDSEGGVSLSWSDK